MGRTCVDDVYASFRIPFPSWSLLRSQGPKFAPNQSSSCYKFTSYPIHTQYPSYSRSDEPQLFLIIWINVQHCSKHGPEICPSVAKVHPFVDALYTITSSKADFPRKITVKSEVPSAESHLRYMKSRLGLWKDHSCSREIIMLPFILHVGYENHRSTELDLWSSFLINPIYPDKAEERQLNEER